MNKHEFFEQLGRGLSGLPQEDIDERLTFHGEMIDDRVEDGLTEEEAVAEIGSPDEIASQIEKFPAHLVVITGGEPTLQLTESLINKIHEQGKMVAIETNGTRPVPKNVDWVTVSPKSPFVGDMGKPILKTAQEVKVVFDGYHLMTDPTFGITASHYFIQPCDTGDKTRNKEIIRQCVEFIKNNPKWKLSLQTQKILGVR